MNKEEFVVRMEELERLAEVGKWKNAFQELVTYYMAAVHKEDWEPYNPDIDYDALAIELIQEMGMGSFIDEV
jgi:hypothetical protein